MNRQILDRMRRTNPVPELELIHESDLAKLTSLVDERRSPMTDLKQPTRPPQPPEVPTEPRWRRPAWIFAAAVIVILVTIGTIALFTGGDSDLPDVGSEPTETTPTSLPTPTTGPAPAPTTTAPTTTIPAPRVLGPPVVDTYVADIAVDAAGDTWVIGYSGGDSDQLFRSRDNEWISVGLPTGFAEPRAVRPAPDGSIWVAGEGGLAHHHDGQWQVYPAPEEITAGGITIAAGNSCGTLAVDSAGGVWAICPDLLMRLAGGELGPVDQFGEIGGGWWLLAGANGTVYNTGYFDLAVFDGSEWSAYECPAPDPFAACAQLLGIDPDGGVWATLGLYGLDGLIRFDGTSFVPEVIEAVTGATDMAMTRDGSLWFAVPDDEDFAFFLTPEQLAEQEPGLFRFDGTTWRRYTTADGLNSNSVKQVEATPDGGLLVGTAIRHVEVGPDGPRGGNIGGGIDVYDPTADRFYPLGGKS